MQNFTVKEKLSLKFLTAKKKAIIENVKTDSQSIHKKNQAWIYIVRAFNIENKQPRTVLELQKLYESFQRADRKKLLSSKKKIANFCKKPLDARNNGLDFRPSEKKNNSPNFDIFVPKAIGSPLNLINHENMTTGNSQANEQTVQSQQALAKKVLTASTNKLNPASQKRKAEDELNLIASHNLVENLIEILKKNCQANQNKLYEIEKKVKKKQLELVEQQIKHDQELFEMTRLNKSEELEFDQKMRTIKLNEILYTHQ